MFYLKPIEISTPRVIRGVTSSTAGEPMSVSIEGSVYDIMIINESSNALHVSFDFGANYIRILPNRDFSITFGSLADQTLLLRSEGASQPFQIVYRLRI